MAARKNGRRNDSLSEKRNKAERLNEKLANEKSARSRGAYFRLVLETRELPVYRLQRFAAEDEGRTEDPTERRKREERDKGNVPRSQDLVSASVLLGTTIVLLFMAVYMFHQIGDMMRRFLGGDYAHWRVMGPVEVRAIVAALFWETGKIMGPALIAGFVIAIVANVTQVGALFTLQPLAFKLERLIPDFKRVLPVRRTMYNLGKVLIQTMIIGAVALIVIVDDFLPMLKTSSMGLKAALGLFAWISFKLLLICGAALLLLSIPDYYYQRYEHIEKLKMTVSESRRERKDEEGDPLVRQRQRERGMELRRQRNMLGEIPGADVVVTNPTHYAVALLYDPALHQAPAVVAKGADHLAFLIRNIAQANNVPVQENPALARVLYGEVEPGQEIPEHLFQAVSVIFAGLDRFRERAGAGV